MKTKKKEKLFEEFFKFATEDPDKFNNEMREIIGNALLILRPILISTSILKDNFGEKLISEVSFEEIYDIARLLNYMMVHIKKISENMMNEFPEEILSSVKEMDKFFEDQINRVVH